MEIIISFRRHVEDDPAQQNFSSFYDACKWVRNHYKSILYDAMYLKDGQTHIPLQIDPSRYWFKNIYLAEHPDPRVESKFKTDQRKEYFTNKGYALITTYPGYCKIHRQSTVRIIAMKEDVKCYSWFDVNCCNLSVSMISEFDPTNAKT